MFGAAPAQDRYAIHYRYKPTELYSLERPHELLTNEALVRRQRENIALDSTDLPVSSKYISAINEKVQKVLYHSHWLNASVVIADPEAVKEISKLPFVEQAILVGRGSGPTVESGKKSDGEPLRLRGSNKRTQTFDFQNEILGIPQMHADGYTGDGIRIAVFDAGFLHADNIPAMAHLIAEGKILGTRDFVIPGSDEVFRADSHGTGALSLMAAYDPSQLVAGAHDASYILCITEDVASEFRIEEYNWVKAAEYADSLGVDIINSSLGYNTFDDVDMNYGKADMDGKTAVITVGASMAAQKGILVVTSGGNEGSLSWKTITAPADAEGILAIGAVSSNLEKAGFSSVGPTADGRTKPELVAYGTGVTLWRYTNGPSFSSGTSFSAPQVAALAAGLWQAHPDWTMEELKDRLIQSGHQYNDPDMELGFGIPNYERAMHGVVNNIEKEILVDKSVRIYPNPLDGDRLFIEYAEAVDQCRMRVFNSSGSLVNQWVLAKNNLEDPFEVSMEGFLPGLYIIELQGRRDEMVLKLLKR